MRTRDHNSSQNARTSSSTGQLGAVEQGLGGQTNGAPSRPGDNSAASASGVHITYTPRPDTSPERELSALAAVYAYIIECHKWKEAAAEGDDEGRTEDGREGGAPEKHPAKEDSA